MKHVIVFRCIIYICVDNRGSKVLSDTAGSKSSIAGFEMERNNNPSAVRRFIGCCHTQQAQSLGALSYTVRRVYVYLRDTVRKDFT